MAAYVITDYKTDPGPAADVLAAMETYLETKDSTTNPIVMCTVVQIGPNRFQGVILHQGT